MKILLVHELFLPDFSGGGEKLVFELAKGLQDKGHIVEVITSGNKNISEYQGIKTHRIKISRYLFNIRAIPTIIKKAKKFDLIQCFSYNSAFPSYIAGLLTKKPVVCTILGVYGSVWKMLRKPSIMFEWLEKVQLNRAFDATIFLSEYSKNIGKSIGMKMNNIHIIPPGVNISHYKPLQKEEFVLFSGRLVKQKGLDLLLETAKLLPDIPFVIMGLGPEEKLLRKKAPKNVEFKNLNFKSGKEFFEMYGKAKVFLLPSQGEGFPIVIVESMAAGCSIVSTIPVPYSGTYIDSRDPKKVASAIKRLFENDNLCKKYSEKNVEKAKQYTWDNFVERSIQVYKTLLN